MNIEELNKKCDRLARIHARGTRFYLEKVVIDKDNIMFRFVATLPDEDPPTHMVDRTFNKCRGEDLDLLHKLKFDVAELKYYLDAETVL